MDYSSELAETTQPPEQFVKENFEESTSVSTPDTRLEKFLAASGLTTEDCPGWRVVDSAELNLALGRHGEGESKVKGPAVEIPFYDLDRKPILDTGIEFRRYRLLNPELNPAIKEPKYLARSGSANHLFIPLRLMEAYEQGPLGRVLIITEGEKKAARACRSGFPTVAIAGVQQWADTMAREAEKYAAKEAGMQVPRISAETPIMPELLALIGRIRPSKILVLFDADGAPVERKAIKLGDIDDPRFKEIRTAAGKRFVLNKDVYAAGQTLAEALRRQHPGLPVAVSYAPHDADRVEVDHGGRPTKRVTLLRQGLDDYLLSAAPETARATVGAMLGLATKAEAPRDIKRLFPMPSTDPGCVALGYSVSQGSTKHYVWSAAKQDVLWASSSDLSRASWYLDVAGVAHVRRNWATVTSDDDDAADEWSINLQAAMISVLSDSDKAGRWTPDFNHGAGVWADGEGLIINCHDGVFKIDAASGDLLDAPRCTPGNQSVYPSVTRGRTSDMIASRADIENIMRTLDKGWTWRRPSDSYMMAGWLCMQAFTGALTARPHAYLVGESNSGKSALSDLLKAFLGTWSIRIADATGTTQAGVRQVMKLDALTLIVDETEPPAGQQAQGKIYQPRHLIQDLLPMLRAAYSYKPGAASDGDYSSVKGTQSGDHREQSLCASALLIGIAPAEMQQADANRTIMLELAHLTEEQMAKGMAEGVPTLPDGVGRQVFRLMWSRWAAYQTALKAVVGRIDSTEPRIKQTLASPIAALLVALGEPADGAMAVELIEQVNRDRCSKNSLDAARPDHEAVLDALLSLPIDLEIGTSRTKMALNTVISRAIGAGMGQRGKTGDDYGVALRLRGMSAKRDEAGKSWLFIAKDHPGFRDTTASISYASIFAILRRTPGAVEAGQRAGVDSRVKLDAKKGGHAGIWLPVEIEIEEGMGTWEAPF